MNYFIYAIIIAAVLVGGWFLADSQGWLGDTATTTSQTATTSPWDIDIEGDTATTTNATSSDTLSATSSTSTGTKATSTSESVKSFTVEGKNYSFSPATMTVKKGDRVRIIFNNTGGLHDWVLDEFNAKTKQLAAGASETIEFVADKAGTFEYYCSVGQHRAMGMKGTLTVTP